MKVTVEFVGSLRHVSQVSKLAFDFNAGDVLHDLISRIITEKPALKQSLFDNEYEDSKIKSLVLINDREISVLNGLSTELNDGDRVVLVPVIHGG